MLDQYKLWLFYPKDVYLRAEINIKPFLCSLRQRCYAYLHRSMFQPSLHFPSPPPFLVHHLLFRTLSSSLSSCHSFSLIFCHPSATIEAIEAIETVKDAEGKIPSISLCVCVCVSLARRGSQPSFSWGQRFSLPTMHWALLNASAQKQRLKPLHAEVTTWNTHTYLSFLLLGTPHKHLFTSGSDATTRHISRTHTERREAGVGAVMVDKFQPGIS